MIIDSVASVVRKEFDTQLQDNMKERNKFLAREAASLKYLAEEFSIPVSFSFSLFFTVLLLLLLKFTDIISIDIIRRKCKTKDFLKVA